MLIRRARYGRCKVKSADNTLCCKGERRQWRIQRTEAGAAVAECEGLLPPKHDAGTATRHYRAFWQRRCRAAAAYILKEKTEEAKRFLCFSDKPLTVIGTYPGFSSPSHFLRVFKTYVGTPAGISGKAHYVIMQGISWQTVLAGQFSKRASFPHSAYRSYCTPAHPPSGLPSRAGAGCGNGHHKVGSFLILRSRYRKKHTFSTKPTL